MKMFDVCGVVGSACLALGVASAGAAQPAEKPAEKGAPAEPAMAEKTAGPSETYPLGTCPISGKKLGSMGGAIVKLYEGREIRFCCKACPPKFEKDLKGGFAKVDDAIARDQAAIYPIETSVVTGEALGEKPVDWVYRNRLIRLGGEGEKEAFQKDPAKYLALLDQAVIERQGKDYPLTKCPSSEDKLGSMGEPKDIVVGGRLVRLCCSACEKDVRKDAAKYIAMLDEARAGKGKKQDVDEKAPGKGKDTR